MNAESIGNEYLNKLCVKIYSKHGVTMYDSLNDRNDTDLLLKYINKGNINLTYNLDVDAVQVLEVKDADV